MYYERKKRRNFISRQACLVNRFTLQGFKPLKSEAIHETGLSGYVVASFFPLIIFILLYFNVSSTLPRENRPADFLHIYVDLFRSGLTMHAYVLWWIHNNFSSEFIMHSYKRLELEIELRNRPRSSRCAPGNTSRWQWRAHTRVSSFSVAYRGHTTRHCARASRGLIDVKPRKQIICNPRFEREIILVRLKLKSNSQYFTFSDQLAKQQYWQS